VLSSRPDCKVSSSIRGMICMCDAEAFGSCAPLVPTGRRSLGREAAAGVGRRRAGVGWFVNCFCNVWTLSEVTYAFVFDRLDLAPCQEPRIDLE
jgi:hypothetical protein